MMNEFEKPLLGIPSGKLQDEALAYLSVQGVDIPYEDPLLPRRMVVELDDERYNLFVAKPKKLPELVANKSLGFAYSCSDGVIESGFEDELVTVRNLPQGVCELELLGRESSGEFDVSGKVIGTSYPEMTRRWLDEQDVGAEVFVWPGGVEGLLRLPDESPSRADLITDLVETGTTKTANGLVSLAKIATVNAVLIENKRAIAPEAFRGLVERQAVPPQTYIPGRYRTLDRLSAQIDASLENPASYTFRFARNSELLAEKLGEEVAELQSEFLNERSSKDDLIGEAQQVVYLLSIAMRQRSIELCDLVAAAEGEVSISAVVELKPGDEDNNIVKSLGASAAKFAFNLNRSSSRKLVKSGSRVLAGLETVLVKRGLTLNDAYQAA